MFLLVNEKLLYKTAAYALFHHLIYPIKQDFLVVSILLYGCATWILKKCIGKRLDGNYTRMLCISLKQFHLATSHKSAAVWPPASYLTKKMCKALLEKQVLTQKHCFLMDSCTWLCWCWLTSKDLLRSALFGYRMQPRRSSRSDGC